MNNCVIVCCDNEYVSKAIVSLKQFESHNANYDKAIIGKSFDDDMKQLCGRFDINLIEVDLTNDFPHLEKRPYGLQYPLECFYHFYAYKALASYDFLVLIEPDIYINKSLDIKLDTVAYIGGTYKEGVSIGSFPAIVRDYPKIREEFGEGNLNSPRILGGLKIYNVKNLTEIGFYEKIIDYYQRSFDIGAPRCGDDSLMVLYQIYNSEHVALLAPETHILNTSAKLYSFDKDTMDSLTMIHYSGNSKWWKVKNVVNMNPIQRYGYENTIEFIYNNFDLKFIEKYLPEIYLNISDVKIPFYYWSGSSNFGDLITPYFLEKFCKDVDYSFDLTGTKPNIISCGSIMRLCKPDSLVYGSGIRDIDQNINSGLIQLVRGPLTRKRLLDINCYCPPDYGDPGLLLPEYYKPTVVKTHPFGIIPHVVHYEIINKMYADFDDVFVINLNNENVESVINDIVSCEKIVSSSLHGLIVSDAYNIPNKWVRFGDEINGDDTKFHDYFQSVGRKDVTYVDCNNYKRLPITILDQIHPVENTFNISNLKQKMFFDERGIKNYTKYLYKSMRVTSLNKNEYFALKYDWTKVDDIYLSAVSSTFLKKQTIHSSELDTVDKHSIEIGDRVKCVWNYNSSYYIVSLV